MSLPANILCLSVFLTELSCQSGFIAAQERFLLCDTSFFSSIVHEDMFVPFYYRSINVTFSFTATCDFQKKKKKRNIVAELR